MLDNDSVDIGIPTGNTMDKDDVSFENEPLSEKVNRPPGQCLDCTYKLIFNNESMYMDLQEG